METFNIGIRHPHLRFPVRNPNPHKSFQLHQVKNILASKASEDIFYPAWKAGKRP
jgi:hypothetical protein